MDYDALKDSWSDIEDRDGIRLSWNVFPSSRMVTIPPLLSLFCANDSEGSFATCGSYRCFVYPPKGKAGYPSSTI